MRRNEEMLICYWENSTGKNHRWPRADSSCCQSPHLPSLTFKPVSRHISPKLCINKSKQIYPVTWHQMLNEAH